MTNVCPSATLEELIQHGLHALRETLQQDKDLTINNTSIGIIGPASAHEEDVSDGSFRILEGEPIDVFLKTMIPKDAPAGGDDDVQMAE